MHPVCDSGRVSPRGGIDGRDNQGTTLWARHGMVGALSFIVVMTPFRELAERHTKFGNEDEYFSKRCTRKI